MTDDGKKKRLTLSGLSPERLEALRRQREALMTPVQPSAEKLQEQEALRKMAAEGLRFGDIVTLDPEKAPTRFDSRLLDNADRFVYLGPSYDDKGRPRTTDDGVPRVVLAPLVRAHNLPATDEFYGLPRAGMVSIGPALPGGTKEVEGWRRDFGASDPDVKAFEEAETRLYEIGSDLGLGSAPLTSAESGFYVNLHGISEWQQDMVVMVPPRLYPGAEKPPQRRTLAKYPEVLDRMKRIVASKLERVTLTPPDANQKNAVAMYHEARQSWANKLRHLSSFRHNFEKWLTLPSRTPEQGDRDKDM